MDDGQPLKIRSDLYLGEKIQDHENSPAEQKSLEKKDLEDMSNDKESDDAGSNSPDNLKSRITNSTNYYPLEHCEDDESKKASDISSSPVIDPGGNTYSSDNISPLPLEKPHCDQTYHWNDTFPYGPYQSKEALSKFSEYYRSLIGPPSKHSQSGGLDLSTKRSGNTSQSPSPPQSPKLFDPFKPFCHDREENRTIADYGSTLRSLYPPSLLFNHLPNHLLPWLLNPQFQNLVQCQNEIKADVGSPDERDSQPLDLSAKRETYESLLTDDEMVSRVIEIKPSGRGRKRADNHKKSYTDEDLHAALTAILVEKLGTRRAAQLYGIPRSTLRNKVHKLTMERERNKRILEKREKLSTSSPDLNGHSRNQSSYLPDDLAACETLKTILKIRLNEKLEEISKNKKTYLSGGEKQEFLGSVMSYLMANLPKLTINADNKEASPLPLSSLILYPQLGEFIHRVVEDKFNEEIIKANSNQRIPYISNYHHLEEKPFSHLNIPVYPPGHIYNNNYESKLYQEGFNISSQSFQQESNSAFKNVLSQIINSKMNYSSHQTDNIVTSPPSLLPLPIHNYNNEDIKDSRAHCDNNKMQHNSSKKRPNSPTNLGGKGSRPKRGKYRNYDRNNLVKAVKAVQSGEMSVHRAGSHFGVPHSTLEYKVKERHLHRGKKKSASNSTTNNSQNSLTSSLIASSLSKDGSQADVQEANSKGNSSDYICNDDVSIIRVEQNPCKKFKSSEGEPVIPSASPFPQHNHPFWNSTSSMHTPFLTNPFSREPLYSSNLIPGHRESQKLYQNYNKDTSDEEIQMEKKSSNDSAQQNFFDMAQGILKEGDDSIKTDIFNSILRKRMENSLHSARSISPHNSSFSPDENTGNPYSAVGSSIPQPGLFIFSSLFPSILAARSSLAAALNTSMTGEVQQENIGLTPPVLKDSVVPIPVEAVSQDGI